MPPTGFVSFFHLLKNIVRDFFLVLKESISLLDALSHFLAKGKQAMQVFWDQMLELVCKCSCNCPDLATQILLVLCCFLLADGNSMDAIKASGVNRARGILMSDNLEIQLC